LRNADRSKISKRKNPVSLNHYRRAGYLPEAMLNFLALMSYSIGEDREEFSLEELVSTFALERISLGGPVFDVGKLAWLNGRYLRRLDTAGMIARLRGHLLSDAYLAEVIPLCRERVDTLEQFYEYAWFFFTGEVAYDDAALAALCPGGRAKSDAAKALATLLEEHATPPLFETMAVLGKETCRRRLAAARAALLAKR